jgi:hypothetical protein
MGETTGAAGAVAGMRRRALVGGAIGAVVIVAAAVYALGGGPAPSLTGVTVTAVSPDTIHLTWVDNSAIEADYRIVRSPVLGVRDLPAGTTSYTWTGLAAGTEYCFQVTAVLGDRRGSAARRCATTPAAP